MKPRLIRNAVWTLGVLLVVTAAGLAQQHPEVALRAAMELETVRGDLRAAIEEYQKIAQRSDRGLAAKALIRMAGCYQKLGDAESRNIYEQVVREYADQNEAVTVARARLAALPQPASVTAASGLTIRKVWEGPDDRGGNLALSPDGRSIASADRESGDLRLRDLVSGESRVVRVGPGAGKVTVSPDGTQIAYEWKTRDGFAELRAIGVDGSEDRLVYRNRELQSIHPGNWSPDGTQIVVMRTLRDRTVQLAVVSVEDGSLQVLKTIGWGYNYWAARFSPDGRYIAFTHPVEDASGRDISVLTADGSREFRMVEHPANDRLLGWVDSNRILVESNRSGSRDAWVIQVADGKPQGPPQLVKKNIAVNGQLGTILGFSRTGAFYYRVSTTMADVHIATLDPSTGNVRAPPRRATAAPVGPTISPDWSPDGRFLAYLRPSRRSIVMRSVGTGEERELPLTVRPRTKYYSRLH